MSGLWFHRSTTLQYALRQNCRTAAGCLEMHEALLRVAVKLISVHILYERRQCTPSKNDTWSATTRFTRNNLVLSTAMTKCRHRCMGNAESVVHEWVFFVGNSLLVFKQVEAAGWTGSVLCLGAHEFLEGTQKPGSILDHNGQASGLNKLIGHGCIAFVPSDLQRVFAPCGRIAQLLLELTRCATVDLSDKVHQRDIVRPDCAGNCQCR